MKSSPVLLVLILGAVAIAQEAPPLPFEGWTAEQISAHQKKSKSKIKLIVRRWSDARDELVVRCPKCRGSGMKVVHSTRGGARRLPCPQCNRTGGYVSKKDFLRVFWEYFSRAYKTPERQQQLENKYRSAQSDPAQAIAELRQIERHRKSSIEVLGNYAMLNIEVKRGGLWQDEVHEFIEDLPATWCIRHEEADQDFVRHKYPDPASARAADGAGKPRKDEPAAGKEPEKRPVPEQQPGEDPAKLFELSQVNLRHIEEDAFKVFGMIKNITEGRRFAYVVVEVGIYKGDRLMETASCNVGTSILKPGETATFSGFIYFDGELEHDRLVPKVVQFTGME